MAKIIQFRLPEPKPLTPEQRSRQVLTTKEAMDLIVSELVCHVVPTWIENQWPLYLLDIMAEQLRSGMLVKAPERVCRYQVEAIVEDLKPLWDSITKEAIRTF